ncbi:MAG: acyltransferase [Wenzhouxiangella sp.]
MKKLLAAIRIGLATVLLSLNSVVHITPLLLVALAKAVIRFERFRAAADRLLMAIAASWIDVNSGMMDRLTDTRVTVHGLPERAMDGHFMVLSNHQSWVDIPVLQKVFNRRLPMLRFFLKSQLIWVPVLGLAWWALDFPFMKRYSRQQIEKNPALAGRDIEATRKACEKFRHIPVSIVNFAEGTRFRASRHQQQNSPFKHLLKARAGGTAFVLDAMGESIDTLIDVTVHYPDGPAELPDLFANRISEVQVHIRTLPIPSELRRGDYQNDPVFRDQFQAWLNQLWQEKDRQLEAMQRGETPGGTVL